MASGRLAMVLAVLEGRCGINLASQDVFLNVAGGLRLSEPAADLAVAAALISSIAKQPVPGDTVLFGEIGLTGEVRPVPLTPQRLKEAGKLGFDTVVAPLPPAPGPPLLMGRKDEGWGDGRDSGKGVCDDT